MSKQGFIYKYTYPNGKVYIGQTRISVRERHYQHMSASKDPKRRTICEVERTKYKGNETSNQTNGWCLSKVLQTT